ncbi:MAG: 5-formyltetrahydrofolate cyclo-ligase [Candidatus Gastranaerophilales bacterium]|nr:5-formyltetrahydrofolate cyclo-ligase [Candidatus Gastranaerophilales bacterium]
MNKNPASQSKKALRDNAKNLRTNLDMADISCKILQNIKKQDFYSDAKHILSFYPFNNEVDLRGLYKDSSKNWYLPRVEMNHKSLIIHGYRNGDTLVKNKWGVYEPCCDLKETDIKQFNMIIIPALMADKNGHRLGYGAGFYDRFIPGLNKECLKIVPVPDKLFVDSLPFDHWDIPVNIVVTEKNIYRLTN